MTSKRKELTIPEDELEKILKHFFTNVLKQEHDIKPLLDFKILKNSYYLLEILQLIKDYGYDKTLEFLQNVSSSEITEQIWEYILEKPDFNEIRNKVHREILIQETEETGVKGVQKCKFCNSNELIFAVKQIRSGDEPATTFVSCLVCKRKWRQD